MTDEDACTVVNREASQSVAGRDLPPVPIGGDGGSIVLFYQYKEPFWTDQEHKRILKQVIALGERHRITGRGRIAPEGLNCTLTAPSGACIRKFCYGLRELDPDLFGQTDFKITDNIPSNKLFKSLSLRKTQELVGYGLAGPEKAPSLSTFGGQHLTADAYHQAMTQSNTVIVDVRNRYETTLGKFSPPPGGAQLVDPQLRNSHEFPAWLSKTREQWKGKTVLMYCTGGIRCERATALLNQLSATDDTQKPAAVHHLQGGIERYLQTYPTGGYWKGKNYLFDRRQEQTPRLKDPQQVEKESSAVCCVCLQPWSVYRGQLQCSSCRVPVIVCETCTSTAATVFKCDLCRQGYRAPTESVDWVKVKRKAEASVGSKKKSKKAKAAPTEAGPSKRLFLSRLPLIVSKTKIAAALKCRIELLYWLTDKTTGAFYGSCIVQTDRPMECPCRIALDTAKKRRQQPIQIAPLRVGTAWPPEGYPGVDTELPPWGGNKTTGTTQTKS